MSNDQKVGAAYLMLWSDIHQETDKSLSQNVRVFYSSRDPNPVLPYTNLSREHGSEPSGLVMRTQVTFYLLADYQLVNKVLFLIKWIKERSKFVLQKYMKMLLD
jgi:hypothetical protein